MVFAYLSLRSKVQQLAAAARNLVRQCGGRVSEHSILQKVSAIGTEGKHWSNCERDLQRLILKKDHALDAEIETVQVRLYNPKTEEETLQPLSMIFPDKLAAALYTTSEPLFKKLFLGDRVDPAKYWTHCRQHAKWMEGHPAMEQTNSEKLIPMSLYGDEVQSFRNTEGGVVSVLAWCSDFSAGMASLSRYFTICVLPDHYTTGGTWTDIWKILAPRINRMCDNRVDHPWSSGGYHFTYSSTQGDLKWLLEKFGLHNFKKNNICSWCGVCKAHENPSMTIGDFREEAEHRQTRISHEQFFHKSWSVPNGLPSYFWNQWLPIGTLHAWCVPFTTTWYREGLQRQCYGISLWNWILRGMAFWPIYQLNESMPTRGIPSVQRVEIQHETSSDSTQVYSFTAFTCATQHVPLFEQQGSRVKGYYFLAVWVCHRKWAEGISYRVGQACGKLHLDICQGFAVAWWY